MTDATKKSVRVVAFQEGDTWVAHCVEYDICAQGFDLAQVRRRMEVALELECEITMKETGEAFKGIGPAPDIYGAMFDSSETSVTSDFDFRIAA